MSAVLILMPSADAVADASARTAVSWSRDRNDPHWVQGQVNVGASPDAVWARVADVPSWPKLLTDIKWVNVLEKRDHGWRLKLETRPFDCGAHEYVVTLNSARTLTFEIDAPGIDSNARVIVLPRG